jgi:hypothetical protein
MVLAQYVLTRTIAENDHPIPSNRCIVLKVIIRRFETILSPAQLLSENYRYSAQHFIAQEPRLDPKWADHAGSSEAKLASLQHYRLGAARY